MYVVSDIDVMTAVLCLYVYVEIYYDKVHNGVEMYQMHFELPPQRQPIQSIQ